MSAVLLQLAVGEEWEPLLRWVEPYHRAYCERHGFEYQPNYELPEECAGREVSWSKIALLRRAFQAGHDFACWLDADALIMRPQIDLRTAVPSGDDTWLGMVGNQGGVTGEDPWHLNAGVIYLRNNVSSRNSLSFVWDNPGDHSWQEQAVINEMLERSNWWGLRLLRPHWNSGPANPVAKPIVKAWHGLGSPAERLAAMQAELA